jgi:Leu/Phe-tRNA-protein transferase
MMIMNKHRSRDKKFFWWQEERIAVAVEEKFHTIKRYERNERAVTKANATGNAKQNLRAIR